MVDVDSKEMRFGKGLGAHELCEVVASAEFHVLPTPGFAIFWSGFVPLDKAFDSSPFEDRRQNPVALSDSLVSTWNGEVVIAADREVVPVVCFGQCDVLEGNKHLRLVGEPVNRWRDRVQDLHLVAAVLVFLYEAQGVGNGQEEVCSDLEVLKVRSTGGFESLEELEMSGPSHLAASLGVANLDYKDWRFDHGCLPSMVEVQTERQKVNAWHFKVLHAAGALLNPDNFSVLPAVIDVVHCLKSVCFAWPVQNCNPSSSRVGLADCNHVDEPVRAEHVTTSDVVMRQGRHPLETSLELLFPGRPQQSDNFGVFDVVRGPQTLANSRQVSLPVVVENPTAAYISQVPQNLKFPEPSPGLSLEDVWFGRGVLSRRSAVACNKVDARVVLESLEIAERERLHRVKLRLSDVVGRQVLALTEWHCLAASCEKKNLKTRTTISFSVDLDFSKQQ